MISSDFRVGIGEDSHRFDVNNSEGKKLILGGVVVDNHIPFISHSDGDVVYHALFNAISSALGKKSIGFYYPDNMEDNKNVNSCVFVEKTKEFLEEDGFLINNISISIEAKIPKIEPIVDDIKENISEIYKIEMSKIGLSVTSGEGLTSFGRGEGIKCLVFVSIVK